MKKLLCFLVGLWSFAAIAQSHMGFNYKGMVSENGQLLTGQPVKIHVYIYQNGNPVYDEFHDTTTDQNGIFRIVIGDGTDGSGDFDQIDWSLPSSYRVYLSTDGGSTYADMGEEEFLAVPFAKYTVQGGSVHALPDLEDVRYLGYSLYLGEGSGTQDDGNDHFNAAAGYFALHGNTSGHSNTGFGTFALYRNTSGYSNTAVGYAALFYSQEATDNTAVGSQTLYYNSSGINNTAVGSGALRNNDTGSRNTGVGYSALAQNESGSENVAMGEWAMYGNATGSRNTATGTGALFSNSSGLSNTAVGYSALYYNRTGNYNTAVGYYALRNGSGFNNSTAIGYDAQISADNQVRIGNDNVTSIGGYANWTNLSDGRFKTDVSENVPGMALVEKLRPVTYRLDMHALAKWHHTPDSLRLKKSEAAKGAELQIGFIAQEVEQAARDLHFDFHAVDKPKNDRDAYGLRYAEFVPVLVKALQEMKAAHVRLQQQVQRQAEKIRMLEEQNRRILQLLDRQQ